MRKIYTLALALIGGFAFAQGLETFENHNVPEGVNYNDGSYVGDNGITWNYFHVTGEQSYPIDGKGILLRRHNPDPAQSAISATFTGGIGNFSVDVRKAFVGNNTRQLELVINGEVVEQFTHDFANGEDDTVVQFTVEDINIEGEIELILRVFGIEDANTNRQVVIDNLTWTGYGTSSVKDNNIAGLSVYPNPLSGNTLYVTSNNSIEKSVAIFDVLGKQVVNTTTSNGAVNVNLNAGVYIVKVTEEGKTATRKLVVR
jgi:hypothetical protein